MIATVNGRAYFEFVNLLKRLSMKHTDILPQQLRDVTLGIDTLILTTKSEAEEYGITHTKTLLFEELSGDQDYDSLLMVSKLHSDKEDLMVLGVDPGDVTGVACIYRGQAVSFASFYSVADTVSYIEKILSFRSKKKVIRIGSGDRRGRRIASILLTLTSDDRSANIEIVDEAGTSKREAETARSIQKDALAALTIARRRGVPYFEVEKGKVRF